MRPWARSRSAHGPRPLGALLASLPFFAAALLPLTSCAPLRSLLQQQQQQKQQPFQNDSDMLGQLLPLPRPATAPAAAPAGYRATMATFSAQPGLPPPPPQASDTIRCTSGACLAAAVADQRVSTVVLLADMTLAAADWASIRPLPVVLDRNLTIGGAAADKRAVLNMGFLSSYIRLAPGVTLTLSAVVLEDWRSGSATRVPGLDIIAPDPAAATTASEASAVPAQLPVLLMRDCAITYRVCAPPSTGVAAATSTSRPAQLPGTNSYASPAPWPANCSNASSGTAPPPPPMQRCWPRVSLFRDFGITATNLDPNNNITIVRSGYLMLLLNVHSLCYSLTPPWCTEMYDPVGCEIYLLSLNGRTPSPPPTAPTPTLTRQLPWRPPAGVGAAIAVGAAALLVFVAVATAWLARQRLYDWRARLLPQYGSVKAQPTEGVRSCGFIANNNDNNSNSSGGGGAAAANAAADARRDPQMPWATTSSGPVDCVAGEPTGAAAAAAAIALDPAASSATTAAAPAVAAAVAAAGTTLSAAAASEAAAAANEAHCDPGDSRHSSRGPLPYNSCRAASADAAVMAADASATITATDPAAASYGEAVITPYTPARSDLVLGVQIRLGMGVGGRGAGLGHPRAAPGRAPAAVQLAPRAPEPAPAGPTPLPAAAAPAAPAPAPAAAAANAEGLDPRRLGRQQRPLHEQQRQQEPPPPPPPASQQAVDEGREPPDCAEELPLLPGGEGPRDFSAAPPSDTSTIWASAVSTSGRGGGGRGGRSNDGPMGRRGADVAASGGAGSAGGGAEVVTLLPVLRGRGAFGSVYEGLWRGGRVAVKVLRLAEGAMAAATSRDERAAAAAAAAAADAGADAGKLAVRRGAAPAVSRGCAEGAEQPGEGNGKEVEEAGKRPPSGARLAGCGGGGGGGGRLLHGIEQEVAVLGRCEHPNVVRLLAACLTPPRVCLVMELMETSLDQLLYGKMAKNGGGGGAGGGGGGGGDDLHQHAPMPLRKVLLIAAQIAAALEYLHPTIAHRDIKPANVLLNEPLSDSPIVKLTDFGLSRLRAGTLPTLHPEAGTPAYLAPECFDVEHNIVLHQSDMYSFGVLLWAMLTRGRPWQGCSILAVAYKVAVLRERPPLEQLSDRRCPPRLRRLVRQCWDPDPLRRPAAAEAAKELRMMLGEHREAQASSSSSSSSGQARDRLLSPTKQSSASLAPSAANAVSAARTAAAAPLHAPGPITPAAPAPAPQCLGPTPHDTRWDPPDSSFFSIGTEGAGGRGPGTGSAPSDVISGSAPAAAAAAVASAGGGAGTTPEAIAAGARFELDSSSAAAGAGADCAAHARARGGPTAGPAAAAAVTSGTSTSCPFSAASTTISHAALARQLEGIELELEMD